MRRAQIPGSRRFGFEVFSSPRCGAPLENRALPAQKSPGQPAPDQCSPDFSNNAHRRGKVVNSQRHTNLRSPQKFAASRARGRGGTRVLVRPSPVRSRFRQILGPVIHIVELSRRTLRQAGRGILVVSQNFLTQHPRVPREKGAGEVQTVSPQRRRQYVL